MTDLITRLREAKEGSRELDARIAAWAGYLKIRAQYGFWSVWRDGDMWCCSGKKDDADDAEQFERAVRAASRCLGMDRLAFTTDLSAAVALLERVLPDYDWIVGRTNGGLTIHAQVGPNKEEFGDSPALALCLAILTAKEKANVD